MGSLVAELAEKLSSATNSLDFDEQTMFLNTSANTVGIGTNAPASKLHVEGTVQVGVNDEGHNVKFFGDTASKYWEWNAGGNAVTVNGDQQFSGVITVGSDDTGHDVKFFGDTTGAYLEWDESADELEIRGPAATPGKLLLSTAETSVVDGNKLGQIDFQAPLDSAGTDAILVGASIWAEADATFSSSDNSTELVFATGESETAVEKLRLDRTGHLTPGVDNTQDLGSASLRWKNIYTTDLHLANERGNWTVIEEEDYLTLRNNKTDKVYKLVMEEIE